MIRRPPALTPARLNRRLGRAMAWLLWLLIALLPLRALSHELMAAADAPSASARQGAQAAPCHGHGAMAAQAPVGGNADNTDHAAGAADDSPPDTLSDTTADTGSPHGCAACDLCHAALAGPSTHVLGAALPRGRARGLRPVGGQAAAPRDGIFKPPRG